MIQESMDCKIDEGPLKRAAAGLATVAALSGPMDTSAAEPKAEQAIEYSKSDIASLIKKAAIKHKVPYTILDAMAWTESRYNPSANSGVGAIGVMQLMPKTAEYLGVKDPWDAAQNIDGGARYLKKLIKMFPGDLRSAVAAYNAGPTNVRRHGGVPPFEETQKYVKKVFGRSSNSYND